MDSYPSRATRAAGIAESAMTPKMGDQQIERITDIIDDGELTAEAQERLRQESLWPLYESLRQKATAAFVFGHPNG